MKDAAEAGDARRHAPICQSRYFSCFATVSASGARRVDFDYHRSASRVSAMLLDILVRRYFAMLVSPLMLRFPESRCFDESSS